MIHDFRFATLIPIVLATLTWGSVAHGQQAAAPQPARAAQSAKPAQPPKATQTAKPAQGAKPAQQAPKPAPAAAAPTIGGVQPTLLGQYGDWGAYSASPGGKKVCFVLAKPVSSKTNPPNRPRDPVYLFVSTRPAEKVKDEVSVIIGYPFKPNTDAALEIGGAHYAMYTQNDGAWIKNAAEEARVVEAMRKGSDLTIKGTSARGTTTTDVFSLKGLSQALDRVGQECR